MIRYNHWKFSYTLEHFNNKTVDMYGLCISIYFITFCANTRGTTGKAWVAVNLTLRERSANSCRKQSVSSNCSGNGDLRGSCRNNQNIWKYASPKALRLAETILSLTGLGCRRWFHSKKSKKQTWGIWEPYFISLLHLSGVEHLGCLQHP